MAAWLDRWIDAHAVELKPSTAASYRDKIRLYLVPAIGHERLQALSPSRLSVVWRDLQARGGKNGKPVSRTHGRVRPGSAAEGDGGRGRRAASSRSTRWSAPRWPSATGSRSTPPGPARRSPRSSRPSPDDRWLPLWQLFACNRDAPRRAVALA